jgi:NAD(P)-dependent dehydrogenase (short-subunit alcohol dehydrogenase family)
LSNPSQTLAHKVVAITGGATGIGFALAKAMGRHGAKIVIGEPRQEYLDKALSELHADDIIASAITLDVTDIDSVNTFAEFAWTTYGQVDILINNAGISGPRGMIDKINVDEARHVFDVNFFGVWHGCAVFSKYMLQQGTPAAIYNVASENAFFVAVPKSPAYIASKHAVFGLTQSLRHDMPSFIHLGTIFPGFVETPLTGPFSAGYAMNADKFAETIMPQIIANEPYVISHAFNKVHIDAQHAEISDAFATFAPRYEGDEEYDVKAMIAKLKAQKDKGA